MSSSSTPEPPGDEAARLALEEVQEAEAILEQQSPKAEAALGEGRGGGGGSGWVTAALAAPGLLWIGFYLIAPLVDDHPRQLLDVDATPASRGPGRPRTTASSSTTRPTGTTCSRRS